MVSFIGTYLHILLYLLDNLPGIFTRMNEDDKTIMIHLLFLSTYMGYCYLGHTVLVVSLLLANLISAG